jgi:hypothetical protein
MALLHQQIERNNSARTTTAGPRLTTSRLDIIAATLPLVEAEVLNPAELAAALDAELETWPPPLNDENSVRWTHEKLKSNPEWASFFT